MVKFSHTYHHAKFETMKDLINSVQDNTYDIFFVESQIYISNEHKQKSIKVFWMGCSVTI